MAKTITQQEAAEQMWFVVAGEAISNWPGLFLLQDEGALRIMVDSGGSRGYPTAKVVYELWDEDDVRGEGIFRSNVMCTPSDVHTGK